MLSHSPDLVANIVKCSAAEKRCYRCQRGAFFNGCDGADSGQSRQRNDLFQERHRHSILR